VDKPLKSVTHSQCDSRLTVTFPVAEHRCPATGTKLYCLLTEAHACEQLAQGRYLTAARPGVEVATSRVASQRLNHYTSRPQFRMQVWNVLHAARLITGRKNCAKIVICAPSHNFVGL